MKRVLKFTKQLQENMYNQFALCKAGAEYVESLKTNSVDGICGQIQNEFLMFVTEVR